jgi:hypothetical protein
VIELKESCRQKVIQCGMEWLENAAEDGLAGRGVCSGESRGMVAGVVAALWECGEYDTASVLRGLLFEV